MTSNGDRRRLRRKQKKAQVKINSKLRNELCKGKAMAPCCYCLFAFLVTDLTLEHKTPRCLGGTNDLDNVDLACQKCNHERGKEAWKIRRELNREKYGR